MKENRIEIENKIEITFLPKNIKQELIAGKTILQYASEVNIAIDGNCAGAGTCGKCKVRILEGNDRAPDAEEKTKLSAQELENGWRLACRFKPQINTAVEVPLTDGASDRKTKLGGMQGSILPTNIYRKECISVDSASITNQVADLDRIAAACGLKEGHKTDAELIRKIPELLDCSRTLTVTLRGNEIVDIESGDVRDQCFGVAVDIGTTTVVGLLWNLLTGECMGVKAVANPQGVFGADVISRITYASKTGENLKNIHEKIIECINGMITEFSAFCGVRTENIYEIAVAGNTTMSHLFLEVNPRQLAVSPFVPVFCGAVEGTAADLNIQANSMARYYLLPNIAGHVGSDITAGILATELLRKPGVSLILDIGTNGEIVLSGKGKAFTCSTAAGPAFEGASIYQGMRAAAGAVEKIKIDDDVYVQVIDGATPTGICGSGIIDAVAQLVSNGLVDKTGRFTKPEVLKLNNVPEKVASRFRRGERGDEFVLVYGDGGHDVVLLQKDVREVQLAKAAIFAGVKILMNQLPVSAEELDRIYIAGAFGNYIDIDSALAIGLLPDVNRDRILSVGNAAGKGACMALLSSEKRKEAEQIALEITHVELASSSEFQDEYLQAMKFKRGLI